MIRSLGTYATSGDVEAMLWEVDIDQSHSIGFDEFVKFCTFAFFDPECLGAVAHDGPSWGQNSQLHACMLEGGREGGYMGPWRLHEAFIPWLLLGHERCGTGAPCVRAGFIDQDALMDGMERLNMPLSEMQAQLLLSICVSVEGEERRITMRQFFEMFMKVCVGGGGRGMAGAFAAVCSWARV